MIVCLAFSMLFFVSQSKNDQGAGIGVSHFVWRVQVRTTPSKSRKLVPMREVRKLQGDPKVTPYSKIKMVCF